MVNQPEHSQSPQPKYLEDLGWRGRVGFISPPSASDDHLEFMRVAPAGFSVYQTMTYVEKFNEGLSFDKIGEASKQLDHAAQTLAQARVDAIAQCGTPFSFLVDNGYQVSQDVQARIEDMVGIPFSMMGLSVVNALKSMGISSVAVAATYYGDDIVEKYTKFLEDAEITVHGMETFLSQGIYSSREELDHALFPLHSRITLGRVYKAARMVAKDHPDADCIVISGGAVPSMDIIQALEHDTGKVVISSLSSLIWEVLYKLGVGESVPSHGQLLAGLGTRR